MTTNFNDETDDQTMMEFLDQYNKEIDIAEAEIEAGDYLSHVAVEILLADRRQKLNRD